MHTLTNDPIRDLTDPCINMKIDQRLEDNIRLYASMDVETITERIHQLDLEWDVERVLEVNTGALALMGILMGFVDKKWLLLSGVMASFMAYHAVKGWSPPVSLLRKLGIRTKHEINREKYALKILRGDFENSQSPHEANLESMVQFALTAADKQ